MQYSNYDEIIAIFTVYKQVFWYLNFANHGRNESFVSTANKPQILMTIGDVTASIAIRRGRKGDPKNRETAQKYAKKPQTASDFFPNTETVHTRRPTIWKLTSPRLGVSFAAFASMFISAVVTEIINIRTKLNPLSGNGTSMTCSPHGTQKDRKLTSSS